MNVSTVPGAQPRLQTAPATDALGVNAAIDLRRLTLLSAQLIGLLVVFWGFNVEGPAFFRLSFCCFVGFLVHYFAPFAWKKRAFIGVSLAGGLVVLGSGQAEAASGLTAWIAALALLGSALVLGLFFYGCLRLRAPFVVRLLPVLAVGAVLAWLRHIRFLPEPFWQVVGAIFMLRMIVYAYEVRVARAPESLTDFLAYFFLLPNFYFVLFPVVDYTTFKRSYYAQDIHRTAQRGIAWIARGTIHLMLYRFIYQRVVIGPDDVQSFGTMCRYVFPAFWLYLHVSGTFHIIVGMLHLFGFNLPRTNHLYFLSSSFTDYWRRINIYWKDFMIKVFYYPAYFRLRKTNETAALVFATVVVFTATALLHSYQMFWLQGAFLLTVEDVLFWTILGVLVLATVLYETRRPARRKRSRGGALAMRLVSTLAVYVTVSFVWSMWDSRNIGDWIDVVMYWR